MGQPTAYHSACVTYHSNLPIWMCDNLLFITQHVQHGIQTFPSGYGTTYCLSLSMCYIAFKLSLLDVGQPTVYHSACVT